MLSLGHVLSPYLAASMSLSINVGERKHTSRDMDMSTGRWLDLSLSSSLGIGLRPNLSIRIDISRVSVLGQCLVLVAVLVWVLV